MLIKRFRPPIVVQIDLDGPELQAMELAGDILIRYQMSLACSYLAHEVDELAEEMRKLLTGEDSGCISLSHWREGIEPIILRVGLPRLLTCLEEFIDSGEWIRSIELMIMGDYDPSELERELRGALATLNKLHQEVREQL